GVAVSLSTAPTAAVALWDAETNRPSCERSHEMAGRRQRRKEIGVRRGRLRWRTEHAIRPGGLAIPCPALRPQRSVIFTDKVCPLDQKGSGPSANPPDNVAFAPLARALLRAASARSPALRRDP